MTSTDTDARNMTAQFARAPHQQARSGAAAQNAPNAALLIDFDNVTMGIRSDLSKELRNLLDSDIIKGKVAVQRAYADWRRYPQYIVPLAEASIDLIFAPAYGSSKKNATDIRLAIDALELVFTRPEIGTFILLSGDSDFSSLVLKLKEYGKYVIGVGMRESSSDLLVQNCDEYYSYSVLSGLIPEGEESVAASDPWSLLAEAVRTMANRRDVMRSDRLKQVMLELYPGFSEKDLGFSKFTRFLAEGVHRGALRINRLGNGQYEVAPVDSDDQDPFVEPGKQRQKRDSGRTEPRKSAATTGPAAAPAERDDKSDAKAEPEQKKPPVKSGDGDKDGSMSAAFKLLRQAIQDLVGSTGGGVRDSDVKRRMLELEPTWNEASLGFAKFSRFLRQAHDAEAIDLRKIDNGAYEVIIGSGTGDSGQRPDSRRQRPGRKQVARDESGKQPAAVGGAQQPEATSSQPPQESKPTKGKSKPEREAADTRDKSEPEEPAAASEEKRPDVEAGETPESKESKPAPQAQEKPAEAASEPAGAQGSGGEGDQTPRIQPLGLRFRRGTRGRTAATPPPLLDGQTVVREGRADVGTTQEKAAEKPPAETRETPEVADKAPKQQVDSKKEQADSKKEQADKKQRQSDSKIEQADSKRRDDSTDAGQIAEAEAAGRGRKKTGKKDSPDAVSRKRAADDRSKAARKPAQGRPARTGRKKAAVSGFSPAKLGLPTERDAVLKHLIGYPKVGKKTAELLVDAFGHKDVFGVLAKEPERVRELVSDDRRADSLIDAWCADYANRLPEPTSGSGTTSSRGQDAGSGGRSGGKPRRPRGRRGGSRRGKRQDS